MDVQLSIPNELWLEVKKAAEEKRVSVQEALLQGINRAFGNKRTIKEESIANREFSWNFESSPLVADEEEIKRRVAYLEKPGVLDRLQTELYSKLEPEDKAWVDRTAGCVSWGVSEAELEQMRLDHIEEKNG